MVFGSMRATIWRLSVLFSTGPPATLGGMDSIVSAVEIHRRYGEGDAAVDALVESLLAPPAEAARETLALLAGVADGLDPSAALAAERAAQVRRLRALGNGSG